ncbi:MAG: type transport system permease protein [Frankiaceae bacterium]|jgi:ABC transporter DrrB family efflux protein|nr:type transport system permease protein [Frankiaceae bacterium]
MTTTTPEAVTPEAQPRPGAPSGSASAFTTLSAVAIRTGLKIARSPQILGIAIVQSVLFLLMFRYVLGGAIGVPGLSYVDFLVPGFVVSGLLFTAGGGSVAVAEESASGLYDRLRSLPVPSVAVLAGRAVTDAALMLVVALVTLGVGFAVGFRTGAAPGHWLLAIGLLVVYALALSGIFVWLGLVSGSAQAAQGLSILAVPFSFLSSAFVPVETMPGVLQAFAAWQPLTFMVNTWRGLLLGDPVTATFGHSLTFYLVGSLVWSAALILLAAPLVLHAYRKD